ncbi:MAG: CRISPR-associated endoribonuclease Cas6 [Oscillospiraceae bacterium]|nr:CRISPR-associated endoribonuclease Cas6 [Oscillospiraceae bacterium]
MLQRLVCKLRLPENSSIKYIPGDALHGVIMEHIDTEYADILHNQDSQPFSQFAEVKNDNIYWTIHTLINEAGQYIVNTIADNKFNSFHLKRLNTDVSIVEKNHSDITMDDLVNQYYFEQSEREFRVEFVTPTAFKRQDTYVFHPDLHLFFGSLMRKHSSIFESSSEIDIETHEILVENSKIVRYDLRSVYYQVERVRLPAFRGTIVIKMSGAQSLINYANFLMRFGEYSGVGIKSAMGMGAFRLIPRNIS